MDNPVNMNEASLETHIEVHTETVRVYRNEMNFFLFYCAITAVSSGTSYYVGVYWLGFVWSCVAVWLLGSGVYKFRRYRAGAKIRDSLVAELHHLRTGSGEFHIEALEKIDHLKGSRNK